MPDFVPLTEKELEWFDTGSAFVEPNLRYQILQVVAEVRAGRKLREAIESVNVWQSRLGDPVKWPKGLWQAETRGAMERYAEALSAYPPAPGTPS